MIQIINACRKNGKSYLGILDTVQSKLSPLDIPFTNIDYMVNSIQPLACSFSFEYDNNLRNLLLPQTSCAQSLYVEGSSAVDPLSIAKVLTCLIFCEFKFIAFRFLHFS